MIQDFLDYWWEKRGDIAVLHDYHSDPTPYDAKSVVQAFENVKRERSWYITEGAYERALQVYRDGILTLGLEVK